MRHCDTYIVRYVPNVVTGDFANVGVFLYYPEAQFLDCMFTDDFRDVLRLHPGADPEFLRELQSHFEHEIGENEKNLSAYLQGMQRSYSNLIQLSDPQPVDADDLMAKLSELFTHYVRPGGGVLLKPDTRMRIKRRLGDALERHGLVNEKAFASDVSVAQWSSTGDGFTFDFAYTAAGGSVEILLIHALSLGRDYELAETLKAKFTVVRAHHPARLIVAHEDIADPSDDKERVSQGILRDRNILFVAVARFDEFAQSLRSELPA